MVHRAEHRSARAGRSGGTGRAVAPRAWSVLWASRSRPDGNIWYTGENAIGKISPAGGTPGGLSLAGLGDEPVLARAITASPDGSLWFTTDSNSIGTITTAGVRLITQGITGQPTLRVTATTNREVYFTEGSSQKIGVVSFCGAVVCQPRVVEAAQDVTIQSALVRPSNVGILVQQLVHGRPVKSDGFHSDITRAACSRCAGTARSTAPGSQTATT